MTQDLLAGCRAADAGRDVYATAAVVAAIPGRVGCVQTDPHRRREPVLAPVSGQPPLDVDRAFDRLGSLSNVTKKPSPVLLTSSPR